MNASSRDEAPMLPAAYLQSDNGNGSPRRGLTPRTRSVSMSFAIESPHSSEYQQNLVGFTGPLRSARRNPQAQMSGPLYPNRNNEFVFKPPQTAAEPENRAKNGDRDYVGRNEHLLRSGQLGKCNDPYCTTCPIFYNANGQQKPSRTSEMIDAKFRNMLYGDAQCWAKRMFLFLLSYIPGVMNPHAKLVQWWNKFFVISCMIAAFLDPLFFFLLFVQKDNKCIELNWPKTKAFLILRTMTDCVYFLHILLQFRLAYVAPESRVAGSGDLVDDPKMIAWHYFSKYFFIDLLVVLPLPQIIILCILPRSVGSPGAKLTKYLLPSGILVQYIPRLCRFLPLVAGFSPIGFTFESAWTNFLMNLLTYILASHVVGSCWYLLSIQRVNQCLEDACGGNKCMAFINCNHGHHKVSFADDSQWDLWKNNEKASACFTKDGFDFGICEAAVNLTTHRDTLDRYLYSLFWGFQQLSTLAGNQEPSYMHMEVVFTMFIIGIGLLLFAWLIGNMQNFLQALGRRRFEKSLRGRDVEQWMSRRRLPKDLRRQVRASERFNWAATRGVNEDMLMENLPEDLQREIRRHLFKFVKKVRIFKLLDEPVIDAIQEKLKTRSYIRDSKILYPGGPIDKIVFIIRGKMMSTGEDGNTSILSEGDVCGEELLTWCLENSSVSKDGTSIKIPRHRLPSNRLVTCLTNVEAFVLRAADFEDVAGLFTRFLKSSLVQGAIRYESPVWRGIAARRIQLAWRRRKKHMNRADSSRVDSSSSPSSRIRSRRR
ncbi:probable cyclic nucleotide-gated ion channel 20, chloroplastic isoform X2 [Salvia miltiorrhiza]|uniref:probable cyclic nucleotide-gated ion channel 20, chloroplastic isoform X2 n=1 Tax=Salvia miltiorrhiza TaxID=226208 RepID=UPI0025AC5D97|nr:probable cyclic nucleotide-gated ion channel 20, chloroplastic isoform X2 [Salvia miltiorrhiza]XP_057812454.1 probable cyclic nucleotide-gated ion channel 20, chloroplastic isoform X2 [Salvia miltiorrhiza]